MFYYRGTDFYAVRPGDYKAHLFKQAAYGQFGPREEHINPLLFNANESPSKEFDIAMESPKTIEDIDSLVAEHRAKLVKEKGILAERESKSLFRN